jgi:hypothetical protein
MGRDRDFLARYGPCALVAGASEGIGAEFARQLAARGLGLVMIARRHEPLEALAQELRRDAGARVRAVALDLGSPDLLERLRPRIEGLEIGLLVYSAAFSVVGGFLEGEIAPRLREIDVNCRGPLLLCHELGRAMAARRRGGIVLVSSLAGFFGSALIPSYAASKAFDTVLGEGLWAELRPHGIDVLALAAGATRTPGFEASRPRRSSNPFAAPMEPGPVAAQALRELGRGPTRVAGARNRLAAFATTRLFSRRRAVETLSRATREMYAGGPAQKREPGSSTSA